MKKVAVLALAVLLALVFSCRMEVGEQFGTISLMIGDRAGSRGFSSEPLLQTDHYHIVAERLSGPGWINGGSGFDDQYNLECSYASVIAGTANLKFVDIRPGRWRLTVIADNCENTAIGEGIGYINLSSEEEKAVEILVQPYNGTGQFHLTIKWPEQIPDALLKPANVHYTCDGITVYEGNDPAQDYAGDIASFVSQGAGWTGTTIDMTMNRGSYLLTVIITDTAGNELWSIKDSIFIVAGDDFAGCYTLGWLDLGVPSMVLTDAVRGPMDPLMGIFGWWDLCDPGAPEEYYILDNVYPKGMGTVAYEEGGGEPVFIHLFPKAWPCDWDEIVEEIESRADRIVWYDDQTIVKEAEYDPCTGWSIDDWWYYCFEPDGFADLGTHNISAVLFSDDTYSIDSTFCCFDPEDIITADQSSVVSAKTFFVVVADCALDLPYIELTTDAGFLPENQYAVAPEPDEDYWIAKAHVKNVSGTPEALKIFVDGTPFPEIPQAIDAVPGREYHFSLVYEPATQLATFTVTGGGQTAKAKVLVFGTIIPTQGFNGRFAAVANAAQNGGVTAISDLRLTTQIGILSLTVPIEGLPLCDVQAPLATSGALSRYCTIEHVPESLPIPLIMQYEISGTFVFEFPASVTENQPSMIIQMFYDD